MTPFDPSIDLERQLGSQIYTALQGPVVEEVLRKTKISSSDAYWRSNMEGHCLKVQPDLLPDFYALCQEVKQRLNFTEPVDFYITMSDKKIATEEVELLYHFGDNIGFSEKEVAASIAEAIQKNYVPSLESIC